MDRLYIALAVAVLLMLTACGELTLDNPNGTGADPLFRASFPHGSAFPHAASEGDMLLVELSDTDTMEPQTVRIYIDGDKVRTINNAGLHMELPFPPATWTPNPGQHTVRMESGGEERALTFSWD